MMHLHCVTVGLVFQQLISKLFELSSLIGGNCAPNEVELPFIEKLSLENDTEKSELENDATLVDASSLLL